MTIASTFDILGPVMVGPSSSHTAGALRIARLAAGLCPGKVVKADFTLYNSFSRTHEGHGTDRALVAGTLGMDADDPRIRDSIDIARQQGLACSFSYADASAGKGMHPNTVDVRLTSDSGTVVCARGESVGGGRARLVLVNGVRVDLTGEMHALFVAHRDVPGMLAMMTAALGNAGINIAHMSSYRTTPGELAYAVFETDTEPAEPVINYVRSAPDVFSATFVRRIGTSAPDAARTELEFESGSDLLALCERTGMTIGGVMQAREQDLRGTEQCEQLIGRVLSVMREETTDTVEQPGLTLGGMISGNAARLSSAPDTLLGPVLKRASSYAMATLERSASMGVIVAAPTAGAAGVLPGALLASAEKLHVSDADLKEALYCAAAIGALIEHGASVSGAEGGCQAEVGTAAAMTAAALAQMCGASPQTCLRASTIAIGNLLGLVCDPVRGLVEVPCQARNVIGVSDAITAAQLAASGISLPVAFDDAVVAMRDVGRSLPASLRETAQGGFAAAAGMSEPSAPASDPDSPASKPSAPASGCASCCEACC
jgi:L-serine dehydratase